MNIAPYIDHTVLKAATTTADIEKACSEAAENHFATVCIPPYHVGHAKKMLEGTDVKVATVVGFPFGYNGAAAKAREIRDAIEAGADEIDMMHNLAALKSNDWATLERGLSACIAPAHNAGKLIKVIVESGMLTDEELIRCCSLYSVYNIDFMKTSTGFGDTGATLHAVKLMRKHLPEEIKIKASGGIRTFAMAKKLIDAGAARIGSSASMQIMAESLKEKE